MKPALIDTDIVSLYLRGHRDVRDRVMDYFEVQEKLYISVITHYEILSGLEHRDARKQMQRFLDFIMECEVCPLTPASVQVSAKQYAKLRKEGRQVDDMDLLIAGTALANGLVMVTHNQRHFGRIEGLPIEDLSEPIS